MCGPLSWAAAAVGAIVAAAGGLLIGTGLEYRADQRRVSQAPFVPTDAQSPPSRYRCTACDDTFATRRSGKEHVADEHDLHVDDPVGTILEELELTQEGQDG